MTTTQTTAPALNDDAVLVILACAGHEGAEIEYAAKLRENVARWATVLDELVQRGLIVAEPGDYYPTPEAVAAAMDAETERVRAAAIARRDAR